MEKNGEQADTNMWYFLDEDCLKDIPENRPYCVRCHKVVDVKKSIKVTLTEIKGAPYFRVANEGEPFEYMGKDCFSSRTTM